MHPDRTYLHSIGTAVPPFRISQLEHSEILAGANGLTRTELLFLKRIYQRSGIESRYSVLEEFGLPYSTDNIIFHPGMNIIPAGVGKRMDLYDEFAPNLALAAANDCLKNCNADIRKNISHIITFSCTGMSAPGLDLQLSALLDLSRSVERTCINFMGCYAAVNAMKSAYHIARSEPDAVVLIAGVELCTLHYRRHADAEHIVSNALFADGAAAAIISSRKNISTEGSYSLDSFHAEYFPQGNDAMVWKIGEFGFDLKLDAYVPALVEQGIAGMMSEAFTKNNIDEKNISHYAIHPGGVKILQACERALNLKEDDTAVSYDILKNFGNMSSVTLLFVLKKLSKKTNPGEKVFACAFGPGLTMESVILTAH